MITQEMLETMIARVGFIRTFWRYLYDERATRPKLTMEQAYYELDAALYGRYKTHLWPTYDAFRHARDKFG